MTVGELIKELEKEDQDAVVYVSDWDCFSEVTGVDTLVQNGKETVIIG